MVEQMTIQSVVTEYAENKSLSKEKIRFLSHEFMRLVEEGDFTKSFGSPPQWIQEELGSSEYKNCTWGHCVCDVLVAIGEAPEHDPLEAPYEFLGAESVRTDEEIAEQYEEEYALWREQTFPGRIKGFREELKRLWDS
jgi:hypothetical protein